jgi:hypothetical protein
MNSVDYTDFELFVVTQIYIGFLIGLLAGRSTMESPLVLVGTIVYLVSILLILSRSLFSDHKNKK